jgi:hypothetical protein
MSDDGMRAFLARLDERMKSMDERGERMEANIEKLKHVLLEGNGSPAITVQVATLDQRLKNLEEDKKDAKIPRHVSVGLIVSIILGVGAILAGFVNA